MMNDDTWMILLFFSIWQFTIQGKKQLSWMIDVFFIQACPDDTGYQCIDHGKATASIQKWPG